MVGGVTWHDLKHNRLTEDVAWSDVILWRVNQTLCCVASEVWFMGLPAWWRVSRWYCSVSNCNEIWTPPHVLSVYSPYPTLQRALPPAGGGGAVGKGNRWHFRLHLMLVCVAGTLHCLYRLSTEYQWFRRCSGNLQRKRAADTSHFYSFNTSSCIKTDVCHIRDTGSSDVQTQAKPGNPIDLWL